MNSFCRFCNNLLTKTFLDLGKTPLANSYLDTDMLQKPESFLPLHAYICSNCLLVQLPEHKHPEQIFSDYAYFSSYSETWLKHAKNYVDLVMSKFKINTTSLVTEIASNDGYLLQFFKKKNIPVMGIEPAANVAKDAIAKSIPTIIKFFDSNLATELTKENKQADLIVGNNVLAHVPTLNDFVKALKILLKPCGLITLEFPHLLQLMKNVQFDTIYHEHFSYFSLLTVQKIFDYHELKIFDVDELSTHGGSLRIYVTHKENNQFNISKNIKNVLNKEQEFGLDKLSTYDAFHKHVYKIKINLTNLINQIKNNSKVIVGYGAPAKGNTLLNYCNITTDQIDYTVDKNPHKQNLFLPGTHIPILSPDKLKETKPDYILILPWNIQDEIINELKFVKQWNCKFIIPIPEVKII